MSCYARAKAELERALVELPPRDRGPAADPRRYAAISVMQPWAWLLASAPTWPKHVQGKTIENRSRPTNYRGPVLIHVSRRWERVGEQLVELRRLGLIGRGCPEPNVAVMRSQLGLVIAVAELVGCRRLGTADPHPWAVAGAWGWELEGIELVQPFGLRGHRGLWFAPPDVRVRRRPRTLELAGLPVPSNPQALGVRVDATTGRASIEVSSFAEAVRVGMQAGIRRVDYVLEVNGAPMKFGELMSNAAAELGDDGASERIRAHLDKLAALRSRDVGAPAREFSEFGPALHGCEEGRRG